MLTWDLIVGNNNGGSSVLGYEINVTVSNVAMTPISVNATIRTYTITGLTGGLTYQISISAYNIHGYGKASLTPLSVITAQPPNPV